MAYRIIGRPEDRIDNDPLTQDVVAGYRVRALDEQTGALAVVFIPREHYSPANVDQAIQHELRLHNEVLSLGGSQPAQ